MGIGRNEPEQRTAVREAARAINLSKIPLRQTEQTKIQSTFMTILRELKQEAGSNLEPSKAATREIIDKMMSELAKGQDALSPSITPEQVTDAILHTVDDAGLSPETFESFRDGVLALFQNMPKMNDIHDE